MSLDKLDNANTFRMTFFSNNDETLARVKEGFNAISGIRVASLTKQTFIVEGDISELERDAENKEIDFSDALCEAEYAGDIEMIQSHIPQAAYE